MPGELKPSQHLGLAQLASQQYDRVSRLHLPTQTDEISFRRATPSNGYWRQREQQETAVAETVSSIGGPAMYSFDEWLYGQGIGPGRGKEELPWRGSLQREGLVEATVAGLVVAYWSYDFRDHAMGQLTKGLLCSHQARNEEFLPPLRGTLADLCT